MAAQNRPSPHIMGPLAPVDSHPLATFWGRSSPLAVPLPAPSATEREPGFVLRAHWPKSRPLLERQEGEGPFERLSLEEQQALWVLRCVMECFGPLARHRMQQLTRAVGNDAALLQEAFDAVSLRGVRPLSRRPYSSGEKGCLIMTARFQHQRVEAARGDRLAMALYALAAVLVPRGIWLPKAPPRPVLSARNFLTH